MTSKRVIAVTDEPGVTYRLAGADWAVSDSGRLTITTGKVIAAEFAAGEWRHVIDDAARADDAAADGGSEDAAPSSAMVRDMLLLAGLDVAPETIDGWTLLEVLAVANWAGAEHLAASDNHVTRLPRPSVLGPAK